MPVRLPPSIRKARPPVDIDQYELHPAGGIRCVATYEGSNGRPIAAILIPVREVDAQWRLVDASGQVIAQPQPEDIRAPARALSGASGHSVRTANIHQPWPDDAAHAVLLLLHPQLPDSGDAEWQVHAEVTPLRTNVFGLALSLGFTGVFAQAEADLDTQMRAAVVQCLRDGTELHRGWLPRRAASPVVPAMPVASVAPAAPVAGTGPGTAMPDVRTASPPLHALAAGTGVGRPAASQGAMPSQSPPEAPSAVAATASAEVPPGAPPNATPQARLAFALSSCQYPAGMLDGDLRRPGGREPTASDIGPAHRSLWQLASRFEQDPELAFAILTGDQIYADATAGLFDAANLLDGLNMAYLRTRDNPGLLRLKKLAPQGLVTLMDDHEVADNWEPLPRMLAPGPDDKEAALAPALRAYHARQRNAWWPLPRRRDERRLFEERTWQGFPFFLADTRTERDGRCAANWRNAHIMQAEQRAQLGQWIARHAGHGPPAFIASAAVLLPRPLCLRDDPAMAQHIDSWCGYPASLQEVLAQAFDADARRLVFLSGDEHLSCAATITVRCAEQPGRSIVLHSIHSSALYAPYPFANATVQDFADSGDVFSFKHADKNGFVRCFSCRVDTFFPDSGDGFALLRVTPQGAAGWRLDVEFNGAQAVRHWAASL